jgi:putative SOS response-associated peptidase YedK
MPVILPREAWSAWLGETAASELKALLKPFPAERICAYPVSAPGQQREERRAVVDSSQ